MDPNTVKVPLQARLTPSVNYADWVKEWFPDARLLTPVLINTLKKQKVLENGRYRKDTTTVAVLLSGRHGLASRMFSPIVHSLELKSWDDEQLTSSPYAHVFLRRSMEIR